MLKVLIVDDEYIMRQGLKYMIDWEGEGYSIVGEATNGDEAMKQVRELSPDIIICDVVMPVMDGVDFTDALHSMYPNIQIIILSGYDNFEYVKHTLMNGVVDYILKPTLTPEELRKVLVKAAEKIPGYKRDEDRGEQSHERKLEKYLLRQGELDADEFKKALSYGYYRLYTVSIMIRDGGAAYPSDALYSKLERSLKELQVIKYLHVLLREEIAVVLFNYEMHDGPSVKNIISEINDGLSVIGSNIFGVVSRSFTDVSETGKVFAEDMAGLVDMGFYHKGQRLIYAEEVENNNGGSSTGDFSSEGARNSAKDSVRLDFFKFNQLLANHQGAEAVSMLETYIDGALRSRINPESLKNQTKNMIYLLLDSLGLSDAEKDNMRYEAFSAIDSAPYEEEYRERIGTIFEKLRNTSDAGDTQGDERVESMLAYIANNYKQDLKLEDLAQEFSFNYNYLSTYFAQHMNEGFSDYLNRIRVNEACRLLVESDIPISQVGMEVGYSDHSYFSRVFKKVTGRTPSDYRRTKTREAEG